MDGYAGAHEGSRSDRSPEWPDDSGADTGLEEPMWQMGLGSSGGGGGGGEPDPAYPEVPTSAVASFRPRAAGFRALTTVASAAKPRSVLLPNGRGWGSGGGLFFVDFVGLCCKYKWARRRFGVSRSRGHPRLLSAGKPAPPSSVKAVLHLERAGHSSSPAASRLISPGQASDEKKVSCWICFWVMHCDCICVLCCETLESKEGELQSFGLCS